MQLFVALNGQQYTQAINFTYTSVDLPTLLDATPTHVPRKAGAQVTLTGDAFINADDKGVCTLELCAALDADTGSCQALLHHAHPACNLMHPARNPMHPACSPMHPACNPMHLACNPM